MLSETEVWFIDPDDAINLASPQHLIKVTRINSAKQTSSQNETGDPKGRGIQHPRQFQSCVGVVLPSQWFGSQSIGKPI